MSLHAGMVVVADGTPEAARAARARAHERPGHGRHPPRRRGLRRGDRLRARARRAHASLERVRERKDVGADARRAVRRDRGSRACARVSASTATPASASRRRHAAQVVDARRRGAPCVPAGTAGSPAVGALEHHAPRRPRRARRCRARHRRAQHLQAQDRRIEALERRRGRACERRRGGCGGSSFVGGLSHRVRPSCYGAPVPSLPSSSPQVVVATHGHCFDGLCSAVMFTRLYRHLRPGDGATFDYHGAGYGPGQNGVDPKLLSGDVNAILDFRFSPAPQARLVLRPPRERVRGARATARPTSSARPSSEDRGQRRMFHDGAYTSATKLIADVGAARFGLDPAPTAELVRWADMIDSAAFPSAKMAGRAQRARAQAHDGRRAPGRRRVPRRDGARASSSSRSPTSRARRTWRRRTSRSVGRTRSS